VEASIAQLHDDAVVWFEWLVVGASKFVAFPFFECLVQQGKVVKLIRLCHDAAACLI
jgi:hypothetical protein